jgi:hypothetical protein
LANCGGLQLQTADDRSLGGEFSQGESAAKATDRQVFLQCGRDNSQQRYFPIHTADTAAHTPQTSPTTRRHSLSLNSTDRTVRVVVRYCRRETARLLKRDFRKKKKIKWETHFSVCTHEFPN